VKNKQKNTKREEEKMLVKIDNDTALEMLLDRLEFWTGDHTTYRLYEQMYESYIDYGCFDGGEFNIMQIVDNDYVNWCTVIEEGDEAYEDIKRLYDEQGITDISCEHGLNHGYSFIEAEYDGAFLVRS
jgi:hypothetical protein